MHADHTAVFALDTLHALVKGMYDVARCSCVTRSIVATAGSGTLFGRIMSEQKYDIRDINASLYELSERERGRHPFIRLFPRIFFSFDGNQLVIKDKTGMFRPEL
jgi:hypothetical protein